MERTRRNREKERNGDGTIEEFARALIDGIRKRILSKIRKLPPLPHASSFFLLHSPACFYSTSVDAPRPIVQIEITTRGSVANRISSGMVALLGTRSSFLRPPCSYSAHSILHSEELYSRVSQDSGRDRSKGRAREKEKE